VRDDVRDDVREDYWLLAGLAVALVVVPLMMRGCL
jgi:hypothetical protein